MYNYSFHSFLESLKLPRPIIMRLIKIDKDSGINERDIKDIYIKIVDWQSDDFLMKELIKFLPEDNLEEYLYYAHLKLALYSKQKYDELKIPEEYFINTMTYFRRILSGDQQIAYDFYDCQWSIRQLTLREFRIGLLEYELCDTYISIHIPSDIELKYDALKSSYKAAYNFFEKYFSNELPMFCQSWMLSPVIPNLLGNTSNLSKFRADFLIIWWDKDNEDYRKWIFDNSEAPVQDFPESTTLQRRLKAYLLTGQSLGVACGQLKSHFQ